MRYLQFIIFSVIILGNLCEAQVITPEGFEQDELRHKYYLQDSSSMQPYYDSLKTILKSELLTGYLSSSLHEPVSFAELEYSINNEASKKIISDSLGRFYVAAKNKIERIQITVNDKEYHSFDSLYQVKGVKRILEINLTPKYKIMLRGRVYAGNMPIEGVHVKILHNETKHELTTLNCYTDDENYWNCLYLGMFKQEIHFENPDDSVSIFLSKEGFKNTRHQLKVSDYDGTVHKYRLRYTSLLPKFPKHSVGVRFGHTFSNSWAVGVVYNRQLQIGSFHRLGIGVDASMLTNKVTTDLNTFPNLPSTSAIDYYTIGLIGGHAGISLTNPLHRYLNFTVGMFLGSSLPEIEFNYQPYLNGKLFLDINKALIWDVRYLNYNLNQNEYEFNPYGQAYKTEVKEAYSKILFSLGLLVSFNTQ